MASSVYYNLVLVLSTLTAVCMAGKTYQAFETPTPFIVAALVKHEKTFFTGDGVIDKRLIYVENGLADCMDACNSYPTCKSFNLALSKPGEWYCESTIYGPDHTSFIVPQDKDGFDNYAFTAQT
ncbi:uncharacterized protein [Clytia hemisphaerica]|uniref:Apple domain-containing protein n=1 Tax=Clytia hemisphaerica TaxID=252671 RepID=A0A7M5V5N9_9CNID